MSNDPFSTPLPSPSKNTKPTEIPGAPKKRSRKEYEETGYVTTSKSEAPTFFRAQKRAKKELHFIEPLAPLTPCRDNFNDKRDPDAPASAIPIPVL